MRAKISTPLVSLVLIAVLACNLPMGTTPSPHGGVPGVTGTAGETAASTLPSGGGPAETETPTVTLTPVAPPHLRVAFISNTSPWIVEPPAPAFQLSPSTGVDGVYLSSDGARVAYVRHDTFDQPAEIRVVNSDGSGDHALLTSAQVGALEAPGGALFVDVYRVKWIPGTHRLLLNTRAQFEGPGLALYDDIFMLDADTGALSTVFTAGNGGDPYPSPDGGKMAISRATFFSVSNIDGSNLHSGAFTFPAVITYSEYQYYPEAVWAADSSLFGVIIPSEDPLAPATTGAIWSVDASTGAATLLATIDGLFFLPAGVLSPTLDRVGYLRRTADPAVNESYVSTLDGSSSLHLGSGTTGVLSFSPDGAYFAYYSGSPTTVYIGSWGGGTAALPGSVMRLKWINGSHFVVAQGTFASWTLQLGDTSGSLGPIATPAGDRIGFDIDE